MKTIKRNWNKTGMRDIINSPHKTFNKQTNVLNNRGNNIANTQISSYIRPYTEINTYGAIHPLGYLQHYDLEWYNDGRVKEYVRGQTDTMWVTEIRMFDKGHNKRTICYFVVNCRTKEIRTFSCANNSKQEELVGWLYEYLFVEGK